MILKASLQPVTPCCCIQDLQCSQHPVGKNPSYSGMASHGHTGGQSSAIQSRAPQALSESPGPSQSPFCLANVVAGIFLFLCFSRWAKETLSARLGHYLKVKFYSEKTNRMQVGKEFGPEALFKNMSVSIFFPMIFKSSVHLNSVAIGLNRASPWLHISSHLVSATSFLCQLQQVT